MISLAPGAAAVAKQMTGLADKVVSTFADAGGQEPLLRFAADFSLPTGGLRDAYYVILGSPYPKYALPRPLPSAASLHVEDGDLLHDGHPVTRWSYVVLEVDTVDVRGRMLGRGEAWYEKLQLADAKADAIANDPFAAERDRRASWDYCEPLLREANVLLYGSPLYLPAEARAIIQKAYVDTRDRIFPKDGTTLGAPPALSPAAIEILGVSDPAELAASALRYGEIEVRAEHRLRQLGILD